MKSYYLQSNPNGTLYPSLCRKCGNDQIDCHCPNHEPQVEVIVTCIICDRTETLIRAIQHIKNATALTYRSCDGSRNGNHWFSYRITRILGKCQCGECEKKTPREQMPLKFSWAYVHMPDELDYIAFGTDAIKKVADNIAQLKTL